MGKHWLPRSYLRNFEDQDEPGTIWQYDRQVAHGRRIPIAAAAQSSDFYPADIESKLNETIEAPALAPLEKLREGSSIDIDERRMVAVYVATMQKRGPKRRKKVSERVPVVLNRIIADFYDEAVTHERFGQLAPSEADRLRDSLESIRKRLEQQPSEAIQQLIEDPFPYDRVVAAIFEMSWTIFTASGPSLFLTSDYPMLSTGLEKGRLYFPLSTKTALAGIVGQKSLSIPRKNLKQNIVRGLNKEVAINADRFVFYHEHVNWIGKLLGTDS